MNPAELANIATLEDSFWWYSGMRRILYAILDPVMAVHRPVRVLEAGCGTGSMARQLEQRYKADVYPTDIASQAVAYARGGGAERVTQADITALPFGSETFDTAVSLDVLVHLAPGSEQRAVAELARVLKRNGLLVLRVAALDALKSRHSQFILEFQRFTKRRLSALLAASGFGIVRCTYANAFLMPLALAKFRIWEPLLSKPPASGVASVPGWMNTLFTKLLSAEANFLARGHDFALGQSLLAVARKGD
jgi:SAM-dependent methyltransferase